MIASNKKHKRDTVLKNFIKNKKSQKHSDLKGKGN